MLNPLCCSCSHRKRISLLMTMYSMLFFMYFPRTLTTTSVYDNRTSYNLMLTLSGMKNLEPKSVFIILSLSVYLFIILLNTVLIVTIILNKPLHEPMYLFICNLCFKELYRATGFYPSFLYLLFSSSHVISYIGCMTQSFIIYTSYMCEYTTLVIMAYDRYVAICRPLEYHRTISTHTVAKALLYSWAFPFIMGFPNVIITSLLPLCGSEIDRLYCDNWSIVKLSCLPGTASNIYGFIVIGVFLAHGVIVLLSYQRLIVACRNSADNKKKFMQTCGPHLLSLLNFTVAVLFDLMFSRYGSKEFPEHLRNFFQIEILVIPPILNPLMYGLKLTEVRKRLFQKCKKY
ncbi:olfactory receptor 52D1-like [Astyanax mexicanus]|uniref:olfactory receptor 52D1-like n=1 Tax=Astyanax mexicanus TaxID=7994 RepID=UPI0020CB3DC9|nr:olfactory receptor 52D1-like [Astyanax mexicanus]